MNTELLRRVALPGVLALLALGSWEAADRSDFSDTTSPPIAYERAPTTPMLSARRLPRTLRAPISDQIMSQVVDDIVSPLIDRNSCAVVRNGDRLIAAVNDASPLIPASNQKLLTTWAALELLGPEFTFTTRVASTAPLVDGVIDGDLYLIGSGDPFLVTDDWLSQYDDVGARHHTRLETLAERVAAAGVTSITGRVIGDESLFDTERVGPWANRLTLQRQSGPLSALTVNENFVSWPSEFRLGALQLRQITDNPPLNAAALFNQLLQAEGVSVGGAPAAGTSPSGSSDVATISSPPLAQVVAHINAYSSNIGAELLLKRLGLEVADEGSTSAGASVVIAALDGADIPLLGVAVVDGSGLSETNSLTCGVLAALLAQSGPDSSLGQSLAVSGEPGSLQERFVDAPAEGLVMAKTGTLQNVRALSGYVESEVEDAQGQYLTFSQISNDADALELVESVQEPLVNALVAYPPGAPVAQLSPGPAIEID